MISKVFSDTSSKGNFDSTRSSLLERALLEDEEAWGQLVKLYSPLINFWCHRKGLFGDDALEVGQEIFLAVHRSLPNFSRGESGSFRGWIRTIASRKIADFYRRGNKFVGKPTGGSTAFVMAGQIPDELGESFVDEEKVVLFRRALSIVENEFQEKHEKAFLLLVVEGWKARDVADELGMTVNAVYMARHHILNRLRSEFGDLVE